MQLPAGLQGLGIPFYKEPEWLKAKSAMQDGHTFHDTYAQFVSTVEAAERRFKSQGVPTIRVFIVMDEFANWCRSTGRKVDSKARADYAALKAANNDATGR